VSIEDDILAISAAWDAALVANNAVAVASFMADDWAYVGPTGATPKADIIGWIASGRLAHHTMQTVAPARVAVHGDTVIVTARKASTGAWEGVAYAADEWISEVYVRHGGKWLCVLSQKCPTAAG
jgi:ketosteroid isomerase-like protein